MKTVTGLVFEFLTNVTLSLSVVPSPKSLNKIDYRNIVDNIYHATLRFHC